MIDILHEPNELQLLDRLSFVILEKRTICHHDRPVLKLFFALLLTFLLLFFISPYSVNSFDIWGTYIFGHKNAAKIYKKEWVSLSSKPSANMDIGSLPFFFFIDVPKKLCAWKNWIWKTIIQNGEKYDQSLSLLTKQPWNIISIIINKRIRSCPLSSIHFSST